MKAGPRVRNWSKGDTTATLKRIVYDPQVLSKLLPSYRVRVSNSKASDGGYLYCRGAVAEYPHYLNNMWDKVFDGAYILWEDQWGTDVYMLAPGAISYALKKERTYLMDWISQQGGITYEDVTVLSTFDRNVMSDVVTPDFYEKRANNKFTYSPMEHKLFSGSCSYIDDVVASSGSLVFGENIDIPITQPLLKSVAQSGEVTVSVNIDDGSNVAAGYTPTDIMHIEQFIGRQYLGTEGNCADIGLSKAKSSFTNADIDLLMTLAEAPKTVKTIAAILRNIVKIFKDVRSGAWRKYAPKLWTRLNKSESLTFNPREMARTVDGMSNIWLELRYSIRPLVYDIIGLLKVLAGEDPLAEHQSYNGFHKEVVNDIGIPIEDLQGNDTGMRLTASCSIEGKAGILGELVCDDPLLKQLGITNIGSLLWDVITYSFIVGWIVDVGQLLYTLNPTVVYQEKGVWVTTRTKCAFRVVKPYASGDGVYDIPMKGYYSKTKRTIDPATRYFTIDIKLNAFKIIDVLALTKDLWLKPAR